MPKTPTVRTPRPVLFVPVPTGDPEGFVRILAQQGLSCNEILDLLDQTISQGPPNIGEWVELRESLKASNCEQLFAPPSPPPTPTPPPPQPRRPLRTLLRSPHSRFT